MPNAFVIQLSKALGTPKKRLAPTLVARLSQQYRQVPNRLSLQGALLGNGRLDWRTAFQIARIIGSCPDWLVGAMKVTPDREEQVAFMLAGLARNVSGAFQDYPEFWLVDRMKECGSDVAHNSVLLWLSGYDDVPPGLRRKVEEILHAQPVDPTTSLSGNPPEISQVDPGTGRAAWPESVALKPALPIHSGQNSQLKVPSRIEVWEHGASLARHPAIQTWRAIAGAADAPGFLYRVQDAMEMRAGRTPQLQAIAAALTDPAEVTWAFALKATQCFGRVVPEFMPKEYRAGYLQDELVLAIALRGRPKPDQDLLPWAMEAIEQESPEIAGTHLTSWMSGTRTPEITALTRLEQVLGFPKGRFIGLLQEPTSEPEPVEVGPFSTRLFRVAKQLLSPLGFGDLGIRVCIALQQEYPTLESVAVDVFQRAEGILPLPLIQCWLSDLETPSDLEREIMGAAISASRGWLATGARHLRDKNRQQDFRELTGRLHRYVRPWRLIARHIETAGEPQSFEDRLRIAFMIRGIIPNTHVKGPAIDAAARYLMNRQFTLKRRNGQILPPVPEELAALARRCGVEMEWLQEGGESAFGTVRFILGSG